MKKKKSIILLISFFVIFIQYSLMAQKYTPDEALEDLKYVREVYLQYHPAPFMWNDSIEFENKYKELSGRISSHIEISHQELAQYLSEFLTATKDGHAQITDNPFQSLWKVFFAKHLYYSISKVGDELYIDRVLKKNSRLKSGDKIISINGISKDSILNTYYRTTTFELESQLKNGAFFLNSIVFKTLFGVKGSIDTKIERDSQLISEKKSGISIVNNNVRTNKYPIDTNSWSYPFKYALYKEAQPIVSYNVTKVDTAAPFLNSQMSYWTLQELNTGIMRIKEFRAENRTIALQEFYERMFRHVVENGTKKLVIDLRDNYGGNKYELQELLFYIYAGKFKCFDKVCFHPDYFSIPGVDYSNNMLYKRQNNRVFIDNSNDSLALKYENFISIEWNQPRYSFDKIYIVVNEACFSQSIVFTNAMKYNFPECQVVGAPIKSSKIFCAGSYFPAIFKKELYTPNANLWVYLSPVCLFPPDRDTTVKELEPDIEIQSKDIDRTIINLLKY